MSRSAQHPVPAVDGEDRRGQVSVAPTTNSTGNPRAPGNSGRGNTDVSNAVTPPTFGSDGHSFVTVGCYVAGNGRAVAAQARDGRA